MTSDLTASATVKEAPPRRARALVNAHGEIVLSLDISIRDWECATISPAEARALRRDLDKAIALATFLQPTEGPRMDYAKAPKWQR